MRFRAPDGARPRGYKSTKLRIRSITYQYEISGHRQCFSIVPSTSTIKIVRPKGQSIRFFRPFKCTNRIVLGPMDRRGKLTIYHFSGILRDIRLTIVSLGSLTIVIVSYTIYRLKRLTKRKYYVNNYSFAITRNRRRFLFRFLVIKLFFVKRLSDVFTTSRFQRLRIINYLRKGNSIKSLPMSNVLYVKRQFMKMSSLPIPLIQRRMINTMFNSRPAGTLARVRSARLYPRVRGAIKNKDTNRPGSTKGSKSNLRRYLRPLYIIILRKKRFIGSGRVRERQSATFLGRPLSVFAISSMGVDQSRRNDFTFYLYTSDRKTSRILGIVPLVRFDHPYIPYRARQYGRRRPIGLRTIRRRIVSNNGNDTYFTRARIRRRNNGKVNLSVISNMDLMIVELMSRRKCLRSILQRPKRVPKGQIYMMVYTIGTRINKTFHQRPLLPRERGNGRTRRRFNQTSRRVLRGQASSECHRTFLPSTLVCTQSFFLSWYFLL